MPYRLTPVVIVAMILILLAAVFTLIRDLAQAEPGNWSLRAAQTIADNLTYVRDHRTGVCYAVNLEPHGSAVTAVPCAQVKELLPR